MIRTKKLLFSTLPVILGSALLGMTQARADILFSGSGNSGFLSPPAGEPWSYGGSSPPGTTDVDWGSPGVDQGFAVYTGSVPATDFEITFGSALDATQIAIGNMSMCGGGAIGGTTLCNLPGLTPWTAVFNPATPDTITFDAPMGQSLTAGEEYFVNIFLLPGTGVSGEAFAGRWSTGTTPLPAALLLFATGLGGLGLLGWRRKRKARVSLLGAD